MSDRKGSKRFREILTKNSRMDHEKNLKNLQQVNTFARLTGSVNTDIRRLKSMMGAWNNNFLPGKIRIFLFKFYNNILGLNSRVAKFNREKDPSCTFCSISNLRPAEQETFAHVFYYCETTNKLLTEFFKRYFTINLPECSVIFNGTISTKDRENRAFQLVMDVFRYHIWTNKLEKKNSGNF